MDVKCLICGAKSHKLFLSRLLRKYDVSHYQCESCGFIQTETPYWIEEAYSNAIASLDVGLVHRNLIYSYAVEQIIKKTFDYNGCFLDYAGGYGLYVRLMRDKGFDFYWEDKYCENLFAKHFALCDIAPNKKFEAVTAFEVFEHLVSPMEEIAELFNYSDTIIFSTEVIPNKPLTTVNDWWYFAPDGGQHISFYTETSLDYIAKQFACNFYTNGSDFHIFTKKRLLENPLLRQRRTAWDKIVDKLVLKLNSTKSNLAPSIPLASKTVTDFQYLENLNNEKCPIKKRLG